MLLTQSCAMLPGVGKVLLAKLEKCQLFTLQDLLFHLPYRYQDRTRITPIRDLRAKEYAVVAGKICKIEMTQGKKRTLRCYIEDSSGILSIRFFYFNTQQLHAFKACPFIIVFGEALLFKQQFEMIHPEYSIHQEENTFLVEENLTPIYPSTEGLSQPTIRQLIKKVFSLTKAEFRQLEWMNEQQLHQHQFLSIADALSLLHYPPPDTQLTQLEEGIHPAVQRLAFEELLAKRLHLELAKKEQQQYKAIVFAENACLTDQFLKLLPFACTQAQLRVYQEIYHDLKQATPMMRLVQGDVGSGKTVIAALAILPIFAAGYQTAFMAPTDLLSEQHYSTLLAWLSPLGVRVGRLSGKMTNKEKREMLRKTLAQEYDLLVGTHALFQENIQFSSLGLIIIDEQHRFGVEQRLLLQKKGDMLETLPHQLLMTATPIPRSLAMTHFAHLDISIIDELPPGRTPIQTAVLPQDQREAIIARLQTALASGKQAYWVCALIEESEKLQCNAAIQTAEILQTCLPQVRVALIHGRLKPQEKESIMLAFKHKEIDLLVATTVIEVGVDVPNASVMIIENAERLGLAQLHQLRGRVGRGTAHSYCLLLYQNPLSKTAKARLHIMRSTQDGFIIAEKDLQIRGAGELLGTKQAGYHTFKIACLKRDAPLIPRVAICANHILMQQQDLMVKIIQSWGQQKAAYLFI